jgi:hypothetical protein
MTSKIVFFILAQVVVGVLCAGNRTEIAARQTTTYWYPWGWHIAWVVLAIVVVSIKLIVFPIFIMWMTYLYFKYLLLNRLIGAKKCSPNLQPYSYGNVWKEGPVYE